MAKRKGRKDLINEIKSLRSQVGKAETMLEDANARYDALLRRFHVLGLYTDNTESWNVIKVVDVDPIPFGLWASVEDTFLKNDVADIEYVQNTLAENLVKSLMKNGYIQLTKGKDPVHGFTAIGAKIYVIPWEQMARGVHPRVYKNLSKGV